MSFYKKTIRDVPIGGHTVLLRADFNVPMKDDGTIADDYRMVQTLPTLRYLIKAGCKIVICAHHGQPHGKFDAKLGFEPIAVRLGELLDQPVGFVQDCVGDRVKVAAKRLKPGGVLMLENLRFHVEEEENDETFAKELADSSGARYFVQDAFGSVHRAHASTDAITHFLPSVAGLLIEKEVTLINQAMQDPKRPLVAVLGGAKVSDKIQMLERLVSIADKVVIGGAMANTFLKHKGLPVGKSKCEEGQDEVIERIYELARQKVGADKVEDFLLLPTDVAVAPEISPKQKRVIVDVKDVGPDDYMLDLGPKSIDAMLEHCKNAKTVVWNGTLGVAEYVVFAYASAKLAMQLADHKDKVFSLVGGGDTADFVVHWDSKKGRSFGHVSTGGGASLELMSGQKLPGVEALLDS